MNNRIFWPVLLIALGVLFLLDNLGILPGSAWGWLWPIILIWLGASLLIRRSAGGRAWETTQDSLGLDGAGSARLTLRHGAGRLAVRAGADPALLYSGTFVGGMERQVERSGDSLDVTLRPPIRDWTEWMWPANWGRDGGLSWNLDLSPAVPLSLTLETGASENRLDLEGLRVTDLTIKTGASSTEVTLPAAAGHTHARIESGAASVKVRVPEGVAARIRGQVGVGAFNVDTARFPRRDGGYESEGFETAQNRVELEVQSGAAEVNVR
jgi:LiaI-LiaF-like transmembrane region